MPGKKLSKKQKKIDRVAPTSNKITGEDIKNLKTKKSKK